jgi:hypothetical protein
MSDKRTSRSDKAAASNNLQGDTPRMSPMHGEILYRLPAIMTEREWAEMTGFPESQYPCSR